MAKVNIFFYNSFVRFYETEIEFLLNKYNIELQENNKEKNENNENLIITNYNKSKYYKQKNDLGHFIKLGINTIEHIILFRNYDWAWKNDTRYWEEVECEGSLMNKKVWHLKQVWWIEMNFNITHIYKGKYQIFLRHCVCYTNPPLSCKIKIFLDEENIYENSYPLQTQIERCKQNHGRNNTNNNNNNDNNSQKGEMTRRTRPLMLRGRGPSLRGGFIVTRNNNFDGKHKLYNELLTEINVPNDNGINLDVGHVIKLSINHANDSCKQNWLIDGLLIKKIK